MALEKELEVALAAVRRASELCRNVQHRLVSEDTLSKKDRSPVTIADLGSQALVCRELRAAFPGDPIVGEEESGIVRENDELRGRVLGLLRDHVPGLVESEMLEAIDLGTAEAKGDRYWTVDPIDGTKGFLRGDQYAVALGLIVEGRVALGVLGCPNLDAGPGGGERTGALFSAAAGAGAFVHVLEGGGRRRIAVDSVRDPADACFCESVESAHGAHDDHGKISSLLGITKEPYRIDSQCKYASVARGDASIYLRLPTRKGYEEKIWDHAAGLIVVEEAGGRVSDVRGKPLDFTAGRTLRENTGVVASNGVLHGRVIAAIGEVL